VDSEACGLSIARQCELLGLPRSTYYYELATESDANLALMRRLDEQFLKTPFYGSRRMAEELSSETELVNRKRVQRLMRIMGIAAIYPQKKTSLPGVGHRVYPYLLRGLTVDRPRQVSCSDITYIPLRQGFMYLVAVMDWYSRYVLSWRLSNTLDTDFCVVAVEDALQQHGPPDIFNTDQGAQFTSHDFTSLLLDHQIAISMDGRGRALDNVFIERLWWSLKYEDIYLKDYESGADLYCGLERYFDFYNHHRKHQALDYRTPHEVFTASVHTTHGRQTQRSKPRRPTLS
jgi:putative transposase